MPDKDEAGSDQTTHLEDGEGAHQDPERTDVAIVLDTPRDGLLVRTAIEERVHTLRGLQKKNADEGYNRAAREVGGDADRLHEDILPQVTVAPELDLETVANLRLGIENRLWPLVRRYVSQPEGEGDRNPQKEMSEQLAARVELYGRKLVEVAYAAGLAARRGTAENIGVKCLGELGEGLV